jgi:hypothetical protein
MNPPDGRWMASDETDPRDLALRLLTAELSGDREGSAQLIATWDGDYVALASALLNWFSILVATAGVQVADPLLVHCRRELLRRAGQAG